MDKIRFSQDCDNDGGFLKRFVKWVTKQARNFGAEPLLPEDWNVLGYKRQDVITGEASVQELLVLIKEIIILRID